MLHRAAIPLSLPQRVRVEHGVSGNTCHAPGAQRVDPFPSSGELCSYAATLGAKGHAGVGDLSESPLWQHSYDRGRPYTGGGGSGSRARNSKSQESAKGAARVNSAANLRLSAKECHPVHAAPNAAAHSKRRERNRAKTYSSIRCTG